MNRNTRGGGRSTPTVPQYQTPPNTWASFDAQLNTREDLAAYFHHTEARLTDLNQRGLAQRMNIKGLRRDARNMANDLGQLVTVRQRYLNRKRRDKGDQKGGAALGQNPAVAAVAALAASRGNCPPATPPSAVTPPVPVVPDPHQVLYSTIPGAVSRLAINAATFPGCVAEFLAGYPNCDEQGIIVIRNAGSSAVDLSVDPMNMCTLLFSTLYTFQPMISANGCLDVLNPVGALIINPLIGGTTDGVTFQAYAMSGTIEPGASIRIHYHCHKSVGG